MNKTQNNTIINFKNRLEQLHYLKNVNNQTVKYFYVKFDIRELSYIANLLKIYLPRTVGSLVGPSYI